MKRKNLAFNIIGVLLIVLFLSPIVLSLGMSLMGQEEISGIQMSLAEDETLSIKSLIPSIPSISQYFNVLLNRRDILSYFWNTIWIVMPVVVGQVIVSVCAAYGFACFEFKFKMFWFTIYVVAMLLPFQVTLVPNFITVVKAGLAGSFAAIIIPGIFSAFGTFFLYQFMKTIPRSLIEAAAIDGANHLRILVQIIIPLSKPFILSLIVLVFIDNWNLVEQPLVMLNDKSQQPLSLFLAHAKDTDFGVAFATSVLYFIPPLLLYFSTSEHLHSGMKNMSLK